MFYRCIVLNHVETLRTGQHTPSGVEGARIIKLPFGHQVVEDFVACVLAKGVGDSMVFIARQSNCLFFYKKLAMALF
jgi:hypothetical protein